MKSSETITFFGVSVILLLIGFISLAFTENHHVTPASVDVSIGRGATNCHGQGMCAASMRGTPTEQTSSTSSSDEDIGDIGEQEGSEEDEVEEFNATFFKNEKGELYLNILKNDITVMDAQTLFMGDSLFFQPDTMTIKGDILNNLEMDVPYFKVIPGYYKVKESDEKFEIQLL